MRYQCVSRRIILLYLSINCSVQFSALTDWVIGGREGRFSRDFLPVFFFAAGPCEQVRRGQECSFFDVVHSAFPLLTMASSTIQGAVKDGFGEAIIKCDMPKSCKFPSLKTVARKGSCGPPWKLILLCTQSLVLCSK